MVSLPPGGLFRLSVARYKAMLDAGIISEADRLELQIFRRRIEQALPTGWFAVTEAPLETADNVPEPDLAVVRGRMEDLAGQDLLQAADVPLVVEAADASLDQDRGTKRDTYASAGIPNYWIANIRGQCVEAFSNPVNGRYTVERVYAAGETIEASLSADTTLRIEIAF